MKRRVPNYFYLYMMVLIAGLSTAGPFLIGIGVNSKVISLLQLAPLGIAAVVYLVKGGTHLCKTEFSFWRDTPFILAVAFGGYFAVLTGYRFLNRAEYMESLHYAASIFGGMAVLELAASWKNRKREMLWLILICDLSILLLGFLGGTFRYSLMMGNVIVVCVYLLLTTPLLSFLEEGAIRKNFYWIICLLHVFTLTFLIFLTGSRVMILLGTVELIGSAVFCIKKKQAFLVRLAAVVLAVAAVLIASYFQLGDFNQEFNRMKYIMGYAHGADADLARFNIEGSDQIRGMLFQRGYEECLKNPVFGTGDVVYEIDMFGVEVSQSSHNCVLESVSAFGLTGSVLLLAVYALFFLRMITRCRTKHQLTAGVWLFAVYAGVGLLEPTVFNIVTAPLFGFAVSNVYSLEAGEQKG